MSSDLHLVDTGYNKPSDSNQSHIQHFKKSTIYEL